MLKKKIATNVISNFVIQIVSFVSTVLMARLGGAAVIGNIGFAMSFQDILKGLIAHSLVNSHLKLYNENPSLGTKTFIVLYTTIKLGLSFLVSIFVLINLLLPTPLYSTIQLYLVLIFVIQECLYIIYEVSNGVNAAKLEIVKATRPTMINSITQGLFKILAVVIGFKEYGISAAILIATVCNLYQPIKYLKSEIVGKFNVQLAKKYLKNATALIFPSLAAVLLVSYDKIYLATHISSETLGHYNVSNRMGLTFLSVGMSMGGIFLSKLSEYKRENLAGSSTALISKYERVFAQFLAPALLVGLFLGQDFLSIFFGNDFLAGYWVLVFSIMNAYVKSSSIPYMNLLMAHDRFTAFSVSSIVYSVLLVLSITFSEAFHIFAAPITVVSLCILFSGLIENTVLLWLCKQILPDLKIIPARILAVCTIGGLFFLVLVLQEQLLISHFLVLGLLFLYLGFVFIFAKFAGFYTPEDFSFIRFSMKRS